MITSYLKSKGLNVKLKSNGNLHVAPKSRITDELREYIKKNKARITEELTRRPPSPPKTHTIKRPKVMVGDEAKELIAEMVPKVLLDKFNKKMASKRHHGCGCHTMQEKMNESGVAGVESDLKKYVTHFDEQIKEVPGGWIIPDAIRNTLAQRFMDTLMDRVKEKDKLLRAKELSNG